MLQVQGSDIVVEYERLVGKLRVSSGMTITPSHFKRALAKLNSRFNNSDPQDAHELLMFLLLQLDSRAPGSDAVEKKSVGRLLSTMWCTSCAYVSSAEEEVFRCLTLQLKSQPRQSLAECLETYCMEEVIPLKEKWRCAKCEQVSVGCKQHTLVCCPRLLIIHLARFDFTAGQMSRNSSEVGVPVAVEVATTRYKLVAVVKHEGSWQSGHYIAQVRSEGGWLGCNDALVGKIQKPSMEWCSDAYLFFYEAAPAKKLPVSDTPEEGGPTTSIESRIRGRNSTWISS